MGVFFVCREEDRQAWRSFHLLVTTCRLKFGMRSKRGSGFRSVQVSGVGCRQTFWQLWPLSRHMSNKSDMVYFGEAFQQKRQIVSKSRGPLNLWVWRMTYVDISCKGTTTEKSHQRSLAYVTGTCRKHGYRVVHASDCIWFVGGQARLKCACSGPLLPNRSCRQER